MGESPHAGPVRHRALSRIASPVLAPACAHSTKHSTVPRMTNTPRKGKAGKHPVSALSPSRAKDYMQCPKLFFYKTILGLRTPPSEATLRGTLAHYAFERIFDHPVGQRDVETALGYVDAAWNVVIDPLPVRAAVPADSFESRLRDAEDRYRESHLPGSSGEKRLIEESVSALALVPAERVDGFLETVRSVVRGWYAMENPEKFTPTERELYVRAQVGPATVHGFIDRFDAIPGKDGVVQHYVSDYKGLALDTPLATPTGWTTMGRVKVGDHVLGTAGQPVLVVEKTPEQRLECFEIIFDDRSRVVADAVHLWEVVAPVPGVYSTIELAELAQTTATMFFPGCEPMIFETAELEMPARDAGRLVGVRDVLSPFTPEYRTLLAVSRSSQEHRLELLSGLLEASAAEFQEGVQVRDEAVLDLVAEILVLSGLPSRTWACDAGVFRTPLTTDEITRRAADPETIALRRLLSIRPTHSVATSCIGVDAPDHLYLAGRGLVPTHNTGKKPSPRFTDEAFFQLEVYALALAESRSISTRQLRLIYTNEANENGVLTRNVTPEILEKTRKKLRAVWDGIAHADHVWHDANLRGDESAMEKAWGTKKQPLCDWCHFGPKHTNVCTAWNPSLAGMLPEERELRLTSRTGGRIDG